MAGVNGRGIDQKIRSFYKPGVMPDRNRNAQGLQTRGKRGMIPVGSAHFAAARPQHLRQPAHAAPADTDHMYALFAFQHGLLPSLPAVGAATLVCLLLYVSAFAMSTRAKQNQRFFLPGVLDAFYAPGHGAVFSDSRRLPGICF
jgi:hypothetical protein